MEQDHCDKDAKPSASSRSTPSPGAGLDKPAHGADTSLNSLYGSFSQLELTGSKNSLHSIMEEGAPALAPAGAPDAMPRPRLAPVRTSWSDLGAGAGSGPGPASDAAPAPNVDPTPRSLVLTSDEGVVLPRDALRGAVEVYGEVAALVALDCTGTRMLLSFYDSRATVLAEHMLDGVELSPGCALRVLRPGAAELAAAEPAALRMSVVAVGAVDGGGPPDAGAAAAALGAYGDVAGVTPDAGSLHVSFYDSRSAVAALADAPTRHGHWLAVWEPVRNDAAADATAAQPPPAASAGASAEPASLPSAGSSGALGSGSLLGQLSFARPASLASTSSRSLDGSVAAAPPSHAPGAALGRPPLGPHHHHAPAPAALAAQQNVEDKIAAALGVSARGGSPPRGAPSSRLSASAFGSSAALLASAGAEGAGRPGGMFGHLPFSASETMLDALLAGTSQQGAGTQQQQQQPHALGAAFGGAGDLSLLRSLGELGLGLPGMAAGHAPSTLPHGSGGSGINLTGLGGGNGSGINLTGLGGGNGSGINLTGLGGGNGSGINLTGLGGGTAAATSAGLDFEALAAELQGMGAAAGGAGPATGVGNAAPGGELGGFGGGSGATAAAFENSLAGLPAPLTAGFLGLPSVPSAPSLASLAQPDLLGFAGTAGLGGGGAAGSLLGGGAGTLRPSASTGSLWAPAGQSDAGAARWGESGAGDLSVALAAQQAQLVQQAQLLQAAQQAALASGAAMQVLQQALLGQGALGGAPAPGPGLADALAAAGLSPATLGLGAGVGQNGGVPGPSAAGSGARPPSQQHQAPAAYMQSGRGGIGTGHHNHAQHYQGGGPRGVPRSRSEAALGGRLARRPLDPSAEAERRSQQERLYALDPDRARSGEDRRTTLMIRNIPNKYTQKMLLALIEEKFRGEYDFFYLPIDFKNKCNVGYAFINMISLLSIPRLWEEFHGKRWPKFNSEKICCINYGRIQGKAALVQHFQNSSLLHEDKRCQPVLFHTEGDRAGEPESFPTDS